MLPEDILDIIFDMKYSMELYERKTLVHQQLKFRAVTWWIRFRIDRDLRYARFLLLL
jgi:hypothetical protein